MLTPLADPFVWRRHRLKGWLPVDPLLLRQRLYYVQHAARHGDGLTRWAIARRTRDYQAWLGAGEPSG